MRPIDADNFECVILQDYTDEFAEGAEYILEKIDEAPTLEVEPVRYGHWITFLDGEDDGVFCSECKEDLLELFPCVDEDHLPRRCPNCGAKMRREGM